MSNKTTEVLIGAVGGSLFGGLLFMLFAPPMVIYSAWAFNDVWLRLAVGVGGCEPIPFAAWAALAFIGKAFLVGIAQSSDVDGDKNSTAHRAAQITTILLMPVFIVIGGRVVAWFIS